MSEACAQHAGWNLRKGRSHLSPGRPQETDRKATRRDGVGAGECAGGAEKGKCTGALCARSQAWSHSCELVLSQGGAAPSGNAFDVWTVDRSGAHRSRAL